MNNILTFNELKEIEWNKKIKEGTLKKIIKKIFYLVKKRDEVIDKENINGSDDNRGTSNDCAGTMKKVCVLE